MPANARSLDHSTPGITIIEPRGLVVRNVAYCRKEAGGATETQVTRQNYNPAAQRVADWDPRLSKQAETEPSIKANLTARFNMRDIALLTDSVDAGWRLMLVNEAGVTCLSWDSRGSRKHVEFDSLLRPVSVIEQEAGSAAKTVERFLFAYNAPPSAEHNTCGRLIRHDDTARTRQIPEYDLTGQPQSETRRFLKHLLTPSWPEELPLRDDLLQSQSFTSALRFAPTSELLEKVDAMGNRQRHQYNIAGYSRQTHLQLHNASEQTVLSEIRYNAFGQVESETAGNGVVSTTTYNAEDGRRLRLVSQHPAGPVLQDLTYEYDPVGNIVRIEDAALTTRYFKNQLTRPESTFGYDTLYQLTKATGRESYLPTEGPDLPGYQPLPPDPKEMANYIQTFTYDAGGNLEKLVHVGAQQYCRQMITAPGSNRSLPSPADGTEPDFPDSFDFNGNLKRFQPGPDMSWNPRNQLQEITLVSRPDSANDSECYAYDGGGQRIRKVTTTQAKNVSHSAEVLYLPDLEIRANSASNEILHVINVQTGSSSVRVLHWETPPPNDVDNDQLRYGFSDHLGSSALELDEQARILSREGYYPFGGTAWFAARSETEGKYKIIRYSGKERDNSGLYYYGFRYYVAWWCRWLNPDPIGILGGMNLYQMVENNPVMNIDPDGRMRRGVDQPVAQGSAPPPVPARPDSTMGGNRELPARPATVTRQKPGLTTILNWKKPSDDLLTKRAQQLLTTSAAEDYPSIVDYIEAGHHAHNSRLRNLKASTDQPLSADTYELVKDLCGLEKMTSQFVAYRSVKTTDSGYRELQAKGRLVTDLGIQSASTTHASAKEWGGSWASGASVAPKSVMILFNEDVQKVNIASGFIPDHVAILPAEKLQIADYKIGTDQKTLYVLLETPSSNNPDEEVFSIFDGTVIGNFSAIQQKLNELRHS